MSSLLSAVIAADVAAFDLDKGGPPDAKELNARLTAAKPKAADPDGDVPLGRKEYPAVVATRFKAADPDAGGPSMRRNSLQPPALLWRPC